MDKSTLFSGQAHYYASARPGYPKELIDFILSFVKQRNVAWDCATGNGQTAVSISPYFRTVVATDISDNQISHAERRPNIDYRVVPAEQSGIDENTVDLVTVSQALHWFDQEAFHREVKRVCAEGAVIAAWYYGMHKIDEIIDGICLKLTGGTLAGYWPNDVNHIHENYRNMSFPYKTVQTPAFSMSAKWTLERFIQYLRSFSATQRYLETTGKDPLETIEADLSTAWGTPYTQRTVEWPIGLMIGYVNSA